MSNFNGIVVYEIGTHGCLNGFYSNNAVKHEVFNEIARKTSGDFEVLQGEYNCSWIDEGNVVKVGTLSIQFQETNYTVEWQNDKGKPVFKGIGYQLNRFQFAVHYTIA